MADRDAQASPQNPNVPSSAAAASEHATEPVSSVPQKIARHSSLRVNTDSTDRSATPLSPQPMTAGAEVPSPYRDIHNNGAFSHVPASTASAATLKHPATGSPVSSNPMTIKRNTSFSQRLHSFLHRDKPTKHISPSMAPVQSLRQNGGGGASGNETPTIAYRTPTTQTHSAETSANQSAAGSTNNSPPATLTPRDSSTNLTKDVKVDAAAAAEPTAYRAQRNFEPVHEDKVFSFSNVGLRSVQRHNIQIQQFMAKDICGSQDQTVPQQQQQQQQQQKSNVVRNANVDGIAHELQQASIEPASTSTVSRGASAHSVSREPSQNTLHHHVQTSSNDNIRDTAAATAATTSSAHPSAITSVAASPVVSDAESPKQKQKLKQNDQYRLSNGSGLAGVTVRSSRPSAEDIAATRERLAAGTTRDHTMHSTDGGDTGGAICAHEDKPDKPCPSMPQKKHTPVYSSHKASLNQFGKQTKVIGKGTGGTVRLLQSTEVNMRPPSLRSGPPSSHNGDTADSNVYVPSQHKLFAVKEFRKKRADETPRSYMKKVTSEFCIGSSVHQENVIETLDLIFEGDRVYEIMEFCPHDLFAFVVKGSMDLDETFCWFKQICRGVQYLHKIGIAHRDLKLENCLLTDRGVVKIIDFGCATVYKTPFQKEPSKVVGFCGSDPYIAPEVVQSHRQVPYYAQVADIWSVGIMYMCMTLLKFPWRIADTEADRNYGSYIRDWPRGRDKLFAQLPKLRLDGQDVIQGMMYPEVKGRFTMDQVMESEWMKEIDFCHTGIPAKTHTHDMKPE